MAFNDYVAQASLLDDFNRANTGPPPSGSWFNGGVSGASSQMAVVSNQLARNSSGWGSAYWGTQIGPDVISYVTIATLGDFELLIRLAGAGSSSTWDAYSFEYVNSSHTIRISKVVNGSYTTLATTTSYTLGAGDKAGLMAIGSSLTAAVYQSGSWTDATTASDSAITATGYPGFWMNGTTPRMDDFYAGEISGAQTVTIGQVTETDTAQAVAPFSEGVARAGVATDTLGTLVSRQISVPGHTVRVQALDQTWETLGTGRLRGTTAEGIAVTYDAWGPETMLFTVKAQRGAQRPDLLPFTPVELEIDGSLVWAGRTIEVPSTEEEHSVSCIGWASHLDDDLYERKYVAASTALWRDRRSHPDAPLGGTALSAAGTVSGGTGAVQFSFPNATALLSGATVGVYVDMGPEPESWIDRYVIEIETSNNNSGTPQIQLMIVSADDALGTVNATTHTNLALTTIGAGPGVTSGSPSAPRRYLIFQIYTTGAYTTVGDAWVRINSTQLFSDTAYESGNASVLVADTVIRDALLHAPLLNQSTELVSTAPAFAIPEFVTGGYTTPRSVIVAVSAYEDYQARIAGADLRTLEYRPKPSAALLEVGDWSGATFSDATSSGVDVLNRIVAEGIDTTGEAAIVFRTPAGLTGASYRLSANQPVNGGFESAISSEWAVSATTLTRDTGVMDSGAASGRVLSSAGAVMVWTTVDGLIPGFSYRWRVRLRKTASWTTGTLYLSAYDSTTGGFSVGVQASNWEETAIAAASVSSSEFGTFDLDFVAKTSTARFGFGDTSGFNSGVNLFYIDNCQLLAVATTLPDKREFVRSRSMPVRSTITPAVLARFADIYLAERVRAPFTGTLTVTGRAVRRVIGGATLAPWLLGLHVGDKIRLTNRVDPDTGGHGRDGRIAAVTYDVDSRVATVSIDDRRDHFETVMARYDRLVN